ncbi:hypothetical protein K438DRAFT_405242 [Mycena galopus ATCC 62051]|nr:hypothetical protein K438DRAFT_405242 [Mycena galopus ATCC 62051]
MRGTFSRQTTAMFSVPGRSFLVTHGDPPSMSGVLGASISFGCFLEHLSTGQLLKPLGNLSPYGSLRERLGHAGLAGVELDTCEPFFRRCFQFDPDMRPSAWDIIVDPWLKSSDMSFLDEED